MMGTVTTVFLMLSVFYADKPPERQSIEVSSIEDCAKEGLALMAHEFEGNVKGRMFSCAIVTGKLHD